MVPARRMQDQRPKNALLAELQNKVVPVFVLFTRLHNLRQVLHFPLVSNPCGPACIAELPVGR
jgi:hypothetical protein